MKKTYTLGIADLNNSGYRRYRCEFEYELKETDSGVVFSMCGGAYTSNGGMGMGGQCCADLLKYFPNDNKAARMVEIWQKYHLNDRHPECEHQRELGWREMASEAVSVDGKTKSRGWLYEVEHESGLLCKPCPVCGYKCGSEWKYMPIPADIIEEIKNW